MQARGFADGFLSSQVSRRSPGSQASRLVLLTQTATRKVQLPGTPPSKSQRGSSSTQRCCGFIPPAFPSSGTLAALSTRHSV
jgi:hypothetical protein